MTKCTLKYRRYRRPFRKPLRTAHGKWSVREGLIVRLVSEDGKEGFGEAAPLTSFGTESLADIEAYLGGLKQPVSYSPRELGALSIRLPCTGFALGSALDMIEGNAPLEGDVVLSALLPNGKPALKALEERKAEGFKSFKVKLGVTIFAKEKPLVAEILKRLPEGAKLRLDANGSFGMKNTCRWLEFLEAHADKVDYLEQPLPVGEIQRMTELRKKFAVPIALDETIGGRASLAELAFLAWDGVMVVKPAITGAPGSIREIVGRLGCRVVYSSVFETAIGMSAVTGLAAATRKEETHGLGTQQFFPAEDGLGMAAFGNRLHLGKDNLSTARKVWESLAE